MKLLNLFSQDGIQRTKGLWSFSIPDNFGRIVLTGSCISANSTAISIGRFDNSIIKAELFTTTGTYKGYNVKLNSGDLTLDNAVVLSVNYYDGYDFLGTNDIPNNDATQFKPEAGYGLQLTSSKSLLTGTVTAKMNADGSIPTYLYSVMYYDNLGRLIQTKSNNQLEEGTEEEHIAYTFTGKIKNRKRVHSAMGKATHAEVYSYSYDHAERLLSVSHQLNEGNALTLAQYTYDEVGRIKSKILHEEIYTTMYKYNVRSWIEKIEGAKFNQTLVYNQPINGITPTKALYNGNISAMKWKAGNETTERGYKFTYDNLSRLTDANYGEGASIASNLNRFDEKLSYDKMGNIMTLQRRGKITSSTYNLIDNLTYTYTGNQLTKVTDAVTTPITNANTLHFVDGANVENEYVYDVNGNLIKDLNKNITSITYNYLNLPNIITFADGNSITYDYDANGNKLSVAYKIGDNIAKTEYVGNKVYKNGTLSMILTEEGYITMNGTTPTYYYFLKDHQGNHRVVMNQNGTVEQVNHYYPFGGLFGEGLQDSNQPYKYNGKEFDGLLGLNMYDYGARHYDPYSGRWINVDPLAEKAPGWTPYRAFLNNPIRYIDPDGRWEKDANGNLVAEKGDNAWTLAKYLNTSSEMSFKMLGQQGYGVNNKGILNLKVGAVFNIEHSSPAPESRENLGFIGNNIRKRAGSEFSMNMFENYWNGDGDVELSGERFAGILMYIKEKSPTASDPTSVNFKGTDGSIIGTGSKKAISFYSSSEYDKVFGTSTLYYNSKGNIIGFYDRYDFDSKPWGERSIKNEIITRTVKTFSPKTAKDFKIRFGYSNRK